MAQQSAIEWTEATWNPVTGCTKISPGCKYCYAHRMSKRLQAMGSKNYINGFDVSLHPHALDIPLKWKKPRTIFVNSMSDLFHEDVPIEYIIEVFAIMKKAHWHTYQILTKRAERLAEVSHLLHWMPHIWMGVSVERKEYVYRIDLLRNTGAYCKFISFEPLLGSLGSINFKNIDWAIVGGESGPKARSMEYEWVKEIKNQCHENKVAFFFKQWGGVQKYKTGRLLDGRTWDEKPRNI